MRPNPAPRPWQGAGYYRFCIAAMLLLGTVALLQSPLAGRVHSATSHALHAAAGGAGGAAAAARTAAKGSASSRTVLVEFSVAGAPRGPTAGHPAGGARRGRGTGGALGPCMLPPI